MTEPTAAVLDASAVLVWLQQETGADVVEPFIDGGAMSAANLAEVLQKAQNAGQDPLSTATSLKALGIRIEPLVEADAYAVAALWFDDSSLSLGDRCCLALARRLGVKAVTADHRWGLLNADVLVIR
jgi:ribonuclease VapC